MHKNNIQINKTSRGFSVGKFTDLYGIECSIQKSSLATTDAIWLGVTNIEAKVLHGDAKRLGIQTEITCGWVSYPYQQKLMLIRACILIANRLLL